MSPPLILAFYQTKLYSLIMRSGKQAVTPRERSKQAQIRDGARRAFLANGFAATSTDAIATEARVSKQTLYVYYRTKEDLFLDVLEDIVGQLPRRSVNDRGPVGRRKLSGIALVLDGAGARADLALDAAGLCRVHAPGIRGDSPHAAT